MKRNAWTGLVRKSAMIGATVLLAGMSMGPGAARAANTPPVAVPDYYQTVAGTLLEIGPAGLLANDYDDDGEALSAALFEGSYNSSTGVNGDGSFSYMPADGFLGTDVFTYVVYDASGNVSEKAAVMVEVLPSNYPPIAADDVYVTTAGELLEIGAPGLLANDGDPDGDGLTAFLFEGSYSSSTGVNSDGSFTYQPAPGFSGVDQFTYVVYDEYGNMSEKATVAIEVVMPSTGGDPGGEEPSGDDSTGAIPGDDDPSVEVDDDALSANHPPIAKRDRYVAIAGYRLVVAGDGILANDRDDDDDALSARLVAKPRHGKVTLNDDGSFTYVAKRDFQGTDVFTYRAFDGQGGSKAQKVSIRVYALPVHW